MDYVDGFPYIEPSLHPWDEAYLIVVKVHFDMFLDLVGKNFFFFFFFFIAEHQYVTLLLDYFPSVTYLSMFTQGKRLVRTRGI